MVDGIPEEAVHEQESGFLGDLPYPGTSAVSPQCIIALIACKEIQEIQQRMCWTE